jgi:hypothetical protein
MAELTLRLPDFSGPALLLQTVVKQTRYWFLLLGCQVVDAARNAHHRAAVALWDWLEDTACSCGRLG